MVNWDNSKSLAENAMAGRDITEPELPTDIDLTNMWENNAVETDKMTVKQFLDYLTGMNWHTERVLVETIIDGRDDLINRACKVRLQHSKDGCLTDENGKERRAIIDEMERS